MIYINIIIIISKIFSKKYNNYNISYLIKILLIKDDNSLLI